MSSPVPDWMNKFNASLLGSTGPLGPSKLTAQYQDRCFERLLKRQSILTGRVEASTPGRVIPDEEKLAIGEGKHFDEMAILFLDICGFSAQPNWTTAEQKRVLATLNIFMGEMLAIVRDYGGTFEKNTGDGLMAYFGEAGKSTAEAVKPAIEAAVTMHYMNDYLIPHFLKKIDCSPIKFRVGIDVGPITLAKVAIHGGSHGSVLAIGTTANLACKLMRQIPEGGICIGDKTYKALPNRWSQSCKAVAASTGHSYRHDDSPYPAWILEYRTPLIPLT